ncbi:NAD(P)/FAD-dependent oxidoreductase [Nocardia sp. NPDC050435]|uniref:flavin-containing monooxygenase n=1 Tax=Nocardia sp. NPDC050435 TaxID=3155040 RepID=UPI003400D88C
MAVIGAGFGGIGMGVALRRAGMNNFAIFEKASDLGGVWRDNTYPGCNCDVPAHLYSFSFAPYRDRHTRYPGQQAILEYLRRVAADEGLEPHLRLGTGIREATYLDEDGRWSLMTDTGHRIMADSVVFAVGQLHRPRIPEVRGRHVFEGAAFHTARWDHTQDLTDRAVAVIGTGSSAAQILPHLAAIARHVEVFQRTPHWVLPKPALRFGPVTSGALGLPGAHRVYRAGLHHGADLALSPIMHRGWSARPAEWIARSHLRRQVPDPQLRARLTPGYPIGAKRIILDNDFYPALSKPHVSLVTAPIQEMTREGIRTVDGEHHRAEVVVWATGFRASEFLSGLSVRGRDGVLLAEQWRDGASAFAGLAVPGFPNLYLIAGPNTFNPAGSNPEMKEAQIAYITACLRWRDETDATAIEVDTDIAQEYDWRIQQALAHTVFGTVRRSWYRHVSGAVTNPWPGSVRQFERFLRHPVAESFHPVVTYVDRRSACHRAGPDVR